MTRLGRFSYYVTPLCVGVTLMDRHATNVARDESEYVKTSDSAVLTNTRIRTGYAVPERHIMEHKGK